MIESFKLPNITPETLTGSIVSFNDEYGNLPLKSCTSLISGYQEGSGTPSPDNVRPLHAYSEINMGMVNWNQLVNKTSYVSSKTINGLTITNNDDGTLTINGTTETSNYVDLTSMSNSYHNIIQGHKYLFLSPEKSSGTTILWGPTALTGYKQFNGSAIFPAVGTGSAYTLGRITHDAGYKYDNYKYYLMMCDLTSLFGNNIADYLYSLEQQTAGAGVALFKQIFYKNYYAYNAGGVLVSAASVNGDTYPPYATVQIGQTIYHGWIDWKRGVVVGTHGIVDLGSLSWATTSWEAYRASIPDIYKPAISSSVAVDNLAEKYNIVSYNELNGNKPNNSLALGTRSAANIYILADTSPTGYLTMELKTPIEIPLGGINLLTQEGQNNIFADCGNTEVKFLKVN